MGRKAASISVHIFRNGLVLPRDAECWYIATCDVFLGTRNSTPTILWWTRCSMQAADSTPCCSYSEGFNKTVSFCTHHSVHNIPPNVCYCHVLYIQIWHPAGPWIKRRYSSPCFSEAFSSHQALELARALPDLMRSCAKRDGPWGIEAQEDSGIFPLWRNWRSCLVVSEVCGILFTAKNPSCN